MRKSKVANALLGTACLLTVALLSVANVSAGGKKGEQAAPLTAAGDLLLAKYSDVLKALQAEIGKAAPMIDEKKTAPFLQAYAAEAVAKSDPEPVPALAQAQAVTFAASKPALAEVESFLSSDKLDPQLIRCAVLANATPHGLAEFAQQGKEHEALVEKLLADVGLMKQMLEANGAKDGKYGQAMQIYTAIQKASPRAKDGILQRLALGTSLEQAVPVTQRSRVDQPDASTKVDPVKRYLHYEKAFLDGELDPAFKNMTTWECRFITNSDAPDHVLAWGREMLRNYRPDHILNPNYGWRYSGVVKTDVQYGSKFTDTDSLEFFQNVICNGGVCGRRAFFGRFIVRAFGLPAWGVTQKAHAATGRWTPDGWVVNLGASWQWSWFDGRTGLDFLLETQARKSPKDYLKALRAQWAGDALGEKKYDSMKAGTGGTWNLLALQQKKLIVAETKPVELAALGQDIAEANEPTKAEAVMKAEVAAADKKIAVGANGVITIPAVACSKPKNNTSNIVFMKSFSGGMQLHSNRLGKGDEDFEYAFDAPQAGKYALGAQVVTVNSDQHLLVAANDAKESVDIALPYTLGRWEKTQPVEIALVKGRNLLRFSRNVPHKGLTIKEFSLTPVSVAQGPRDAKTEPKKDAPKQDAPPKTDIPKKNVAKKEIAKQDASKLDVPKLDIARPDGKPADMTKPVQVFILMGQSNMVGMGKIVGGEGSLDYAVKEKKKYPYLVDDAGKWTERKDVRNVRVMVGKGGGMQLFNNEWMSVKGKTIGPEVAIGHVVGNAVDAPVMLLKSCIGNRALGWDLLPPGSERFEYEGKVYAGYKDSPESWVKGTEPKAINWYAGKQYDDDTANAKKVLAELDKYYPGAKGYEVAGFFFWQGERDCGSAALSSRYEQNLVRFIKQLRKDFNAPNAKFVLATLGEAVKGSKGNGGMVLGAQLAVDGATGKYPEFKGNVATVYSNPLSLGGSGNSHYGGNSETYMNVGESMGKAMADLLTTKK